MIMIWSGRLESGIDLHDGDNDDDDDNLACYDYYDVIWATDHTAAAGISPN